MRNTGTDMNASQHPNKFEPTAKRLWRGFCVCATIVALSQSAAAAFRDSVPAIDDTPCRFRPQQLIAPAALITVGAIGVSNDWFVDLKNDWRDNLYDWRGDHRFHIDDYAQYLPIASNVGLGFVGVPARHPFRERFVVSATGYVTMQTIVWVTKYFVNEKRPDSNARNSFPSGHTAMAFVGAEMIRKEYGNAWGAGAYVFASGIGFMRTYNDRHWLNDVIGGAGVGIMAANIAYWVLPLERKILRWDSESAEMSIVPIYNSDDKSFRIAFTAMF